MKHFVLTFSVLLCVLCSQAKTVYSVSNGYWNSSFTWSDTAVPKPTDTVVIDHYVIFTDTLFIDSIGHLLIDSCGTLCGDHHVQGHFINYGYMYIGSFRIYAPTLNYGYITCNNTGYSGVTSGYMALHSGWLKVGPYTPACQEPRGIADCQRTTGITKQEVLQFSLYPNPTSTYVNIEFAEPDKITSAELIDIAGRVLQTFDVENATTTIPVKDLLPGYYTLLLNTTDGRSASKRFLKLAD